MDEYIIKKGTLSEWQKWLNQWRHDYELEILFSHPVSDGEVGVIIGLKRTPKKVTHAQGTGMNEMTSVFGLDNKMLKEPDDGSAPWDE